MKPATRIKKIEQAEKTLRAINLRKQGFSYEQIASRMGLADRSCAYNLINRAMTRDRREATAELLEIELERLDAIWIKLYPDRGKPEVASAMLRVMERRAKYLGLDVPTKSEIGGPNGAPLIEIDMETAVKAAAELVHASAEQPKGPEPD